MSRYGSLKELDELCLIDGIELIAKAYEKQAEERAFKLYAAQYVWMNEDNFVTFNDFFNPDKQVTDDRPASNILSEVRTLLNTNKGGWTQ